MKEHALSYTYDRMKMIFPLVFFLCTLFLFALKHTQKNLSKKILCAVFVFACVLNFFSYQKSKFYFWKTDFRAKNEKFSQEMEKYKNDCVYGYEKAVRGYLNMTFGRGIFEWTNFPTLKKIAQEKNARYAALIVSQENKKSAWNMRDIFCVEIFDLFEEKIFRIFYDEKEDRVFSCDHFCAASLSDKNWNLGVSRSRQTVLFYNDKALLEKILQSQVLCVQGQKIKIVHAESDEKWIRVFLEQNAEAARFPNKIAFE